MKVKARGVAISINKQESKPNDGDFTDEDSDLDDRKSTKSAVAGSGRDEDDVLERLADHAYGLVKRMLMFILHSSTRLRMDEKNLPRNSNSLKIATRLRL